ncbi:MAG: hypothetical protein RL757_1693 [Bacteroidota bacterium]
MKIRIFLAAIVFFLLQNQPLSAQVRPATAPKDSVEILYSDLLEYTMRGTEQVKKLKGRCRLRQRNALLFCDSAIVDNASNVLARGNVVMQQADSVTIFADSANYFGSRRVADLFGKEVVLVSADKKLFTKQLNYDLNTKIATYNTTSTLANSRTQLTSRRGSYNVASNEAFFKDQVSVVDTKFSLKTDTLKFDTKNNVATFLAPTLILQDTAQIYTEAGKYDINNEYAEFTRTPQYLKNDQSAQADTMRYDGKEKLLSLFGNARTRNATQQASANQIRYFQKTEETFLEGNARFSDTTQNIASDTIQFNGKSKNFATRGRSRIADKAQILEADVVDFNSTDSIGVAHGNVIWVDTIQKISIKSSDIEYDRRRDYVKASGKRPLMTNIIENDTLWLRADTILSYKKNITDTTRQLQAWRNTRLFKKDFQAVCDSLAFSETDSIFRLFYQPVIWSDTSQFSGDTIRLLLKNQKIHQLVIRREAFIINSRDNIYFNQIKGRNCTAFFEDGKVRRVHVEGNAQSTYYALDEKNAYIGVNSAQCSEMMIYFGDSKVEKIVFLSQPVAKMEPMKQADHEKLKLKGFKWWTERRPKSWKDL